MVILMLMIPSFSFAFRYDIKWAPGHFNLPPGTTEWYVTQGNNVQSILFTSGHHRVRVESKSIIWPRGSGEIVMNFPGQWYGGVGHFSLDEKLDTTMQRQGDSNHFVGRKATNFWWRETGVYYEAQQDLDGDGKMDLPQGSLKLKVSTREGDLEGWPPEFRTDVDGDGKGDLNGDPIVISDEDVIETMYSIFGRYVPEAAAKQMADSYLQEPQVIISVFPLKFISWDYSFYSP